MVIPSLLIIVGIFLLIYGASFLVDGASSVARRFGISPLAIGLTIVAFGTSAPELVVNIAASIRGSADIAIGNVIGSNLVNLLLILGIAGTITTLRVQKSTTWKEIPFSFLAVIAAFVLANDLWFGNPILSLSRADGIILLLFFVIFMYYTVGISKNGSDNDEGPVKKIAAPRASFMIVLGLLALFFGGKFTVDGAVAIARAMGVTEAFIGFTIVAIGTSLPELVTSLVAAARKQADIAVGNIVGSNIFNIFFILGISSIILPIPFAPSFNIDLILLMGTTFLLFISMFIGKRHTLERWQAFAFVILYLAYLGYLVIRG